MFIMMLIANARYMLMSCAMSQRFAPDMPFWHRLCIAFDVTDELFSISVAHEGCIDPYYTYGAMLIASPCWTVGTGLGVLVGEILPLRLVSAFSVALYGMFLAVITAGPGFTLPFAATVMSINSYASARRAAGTDE